MLQEYETCVKCSLQPFRTRRGVETEEGCMQCPDKRMICCPDSDLRCERHVYRYDRALAELACDEEPSGEFFYKGFDDSESQT